MVKWFMKVDDYMFCRNCGNQLTDNDKFCGKCGTPAFVPNAVQTTPMVNNTARGVDTNTEKILYGAVGFISPLIGLVISLASKKDKPEAAKIGIIVSVISFTLRLIYFVFWFMFGFLQAI